jgi:hypothetical protein
MEGGQEVVVTKFSAAANDARFLAQERIVDALLRALALEQPALLATVRNILIDTEFTHQGKPEADMSVNQQIQSRLLEAARFAKDHGASQA